MGADTKQLRNRIKSVDSTLHLTKAMGLVASSKIRRATDAMNKSRAYAKAINNLIKLLAVSPECAKSPFMTEREGNRTRIIIIAGDRGLAGGYNSNIFKLTDTVNATEIIPVGKRACDRYGKEQLKVETYSYDDAIVLANRLCEDFKNGRYEKLA